MGTILRRCAFLAALLALAILPARGQAAILTKLLEWGSPGEGDGQFIGPIGIATDATGNVYVLDMFLNRVQKFTANGVFLTKWGSLGNNPGQFFYPHDITVGSNGNVYVCDTYRIQVFNSTGGFLSQWGPCYDFNNPGCFGSINGVETDNAGNVLAVDGALNSSHKHNGASWSKWSVMLPGNQTFTIKRFDVDSNGRYAIGNDDHDRIEFYSSTGTWLSSLGSYGSGNGQFDEPTSVSFDSNNNLYVADLQNYRIQKFASNGAYLGQYDQGPFGLQPSDVHAAANDIVYVVQNGGSIAKLGPSTVSVSPGEDAASLSLAIAPNPSRADTRVTFSLPAAGHARVEVLDVNGRRVALALDGEMPAGPHEVVWNGRSQDGSAVAAGVYFARLVTPGGSGQKSFVRLK